MRFGSAGHGIYRYLVLINAFVLASADVFAFVLTWALFRRGSSVAALMFIKPNSSELARLDVFFILGLLFIAVRYVSGDYSRRRLFWDNARSTTLTLAVLAVPCLLILVAVPDQYSKFAEIGSWSFLMFAIPLLRQGARIIMKFMGVWRVPTALIASGSRIADVYETLSTNLSLGCEIRWLALENGEASPPEYAAKLKFLPQAQPKDMAISLLVDGCSQAVVATDDMQSPQFGDLIQRLMEAGIAVSFIPSFRRLPLVGVTTSYFFGKDILLFQVRSSLQRLPSRAAKRLFDIFGSICLLVALSPLFAFAALAIKLHDGGPVIYSQKRTGRRGEPFQCLKFRSMAVDAEARLDRWSKENPELYADFLKTFKLIDDPRVTRPGKWLRSTSLDELPQLVNVLRGEMSLVGPRPVLERELIEYYGPAAQLYKQVRPGLTGLWQVRGRSDTTYEERVVFDEWYILNWSFWYDIVILLQTIWIVCLRKGAY